MTGALPLFTYRGTRSTSLRALLKVCTRLSIFSGYSASRDTDRRSPKTRTAAKDLSYFDGVAQLRDGRLGRAVPSFNPSTVSLAQAVGQLHSALDAKGVTPISAESEYVAPNPSSYPKRRRPKCSRWLTRSNKTTPCSACFTTSRRPAKKIGSALSVIVAIKSIMWRDRLGHFVRAVERRFGV
jgi:hypothetical protein